MKTEYPGKDETEDAFNYSPPFQPANDNTTHSPRKLLVWGADGRVQVKKAAYPYSAVGQFVGLTAQDEGYSCSGALIEKAAILTAGESSYCVVQGTSSVYCLFCMEKQQRTAFKVSVIRLLNDWRTHTGGCHEHH